MPTLTAKQRLQKLVAAFGAREGLRRLLALDGVATPGAADGSAKPVPSQPLVLPAWITDERADAIVSHFLHRDLLLPWQVAPFWQDQWVAEGWPMVGAATVPSWQGAGAGAPSAGFAAWQASPVSAASALKEAAQAVPPEPPAALPDVPLQLWTALVTQHGDAAWLWTKYRKYFQVVAGERPLLAGVLLGHEVAQGTLQLTLTQANGAAQQPKTAVVEVDCFAYTLAVAIGVLESNDFATVHNVMPKGYPSQWQAPEPATTVWVSPLHGDARFWHEFDEPPVGDPGRFVRHGLTRLEAVRVWARRVAVCLWGDANGHWGRWPWRLATTSLAMRRRLLAWDPVDPRLLSATTNPELGPSSKAKARYGFQVTATAGTGIQPQTSSLFEAFGQAMWPGWRTSRDGTRQLTDDYRGYVVWDTNPYLAWHFAWHLSGPSSALPTAPSLPGLKPIELATHWIAASFQVMGMWHGVGWLEAKPTLARAKSGEYAGKSTRAVHRAWGVPANAHVCSLAEVLDVNMGGCQTNGIVALSLMRSQCIPVVPSRDAFLGWGGSTTEYEVPGTGAEARFVPPSLIQSDGAGAVSGHLSLQAGFDSEQRILQHSDRMLADRLGIFADPTRVWLPLAEHLLVLAALDENEAPLLPIVQVVVAEHESRRTLDALVRSSMNWKARRHLAHQFDEDRGHDITPYATSRLAWFLAAEKTLGTDVVRTLQDGPWSVQAEELLKSAGDDLGPDMDLSLEEHSSSVRWLVARLLGIDGQQVWGPIGNTIKSVPSASKTEPVGSYLSAAPWPRNFWFIGATGQQPYNYLTTAGLTSEQPAAAQAVLGLALAVFRASRADARG